MKPDQAANTLESFLAKADLEEPTKDNLERAFGLKSADVFVLFGGSILQGVDILARAVKEKRAKTYVIVGGAGHTTDTLREIVRTYHPEMETDGRTEAELFDDCLNDTYGLRADLLETQSTNCGNNITLFLELLEDRGINFESIILCQDVSMQRRMTATLEKHVSPNQKIISLPAYRARFEMRDGELGMSDGTRGLQGIWEVRRLPSLLMGHRMMP